MLNNVLGESVCESPIRYNTFSSPIPFFSPHFSFFHEFVMRGMCRCENNVVNASILRQKRKIYNVFFSASLYS